MNKAVMNTTEVNNIIEKMIMYSEEEEKDLKKIKEKLGQLETNYQSYNAKKIEESNFEITSHFETIIENRKKYIRTLKTNMENYIRQAQDTVNIFQNMEDNHGR